MGHGARTCKKLISTLKKLHPEGNEQKAYIVKPTIYLDSAASSHMTNKLEWLEDFEELNGTVAIRDGTKLMIKRKGSLPLSIRMEEGVVDYEVERVLYIPDLSDTLLSIGEIAKEGHKAIFEGNSI